MNVANKSIVRKLTARFLKAAKTRNIIAVIAITLTSVMFASVFTIGGNMLAAIQEQTMRQVGTSAHGGLKYLTREQYENFAASPLIQDISHNIILALAENDALQKGQHEIRYAEDKMARWGFSFPTAGKMPQSANEIACGTITLDALGLPHERGASVPLEFTVGGVKYTETFTLCGYWTGDPVMAAQQVWLSETYVECVLAANEINDGITGTISADIWFGSAFDIEGKLRELIAERGYADGGIEYGVNWAYAASGLDLDPTAAAIGALVLALILLSGYLIIHSIFAISVTADIHFFGLLKTIGATGRQIRRIVRGQALVLSAFGIPLGLLFGYFSGMALAPLTLGMLSVSFPAAASANPLIFIIAAAFSLLTVLIGCRKPAKLAARISPVEAVQFSGVSVGGGRGTKRTRKVTPLSMAWANVTRERRKFAVIILSLALALILLNSAYSAAKSFDMDAYVSGSLISDFAVADYSLFSGATANKKNTSGVTADFLSEAAKRGGEISNIYYYERRNPEGAENMQVYGVRQPELARFSDIDYEKLRSGNYAVVSGYVIAYGDAAPTVPQVGDMITLKNSDGDTRDFEVADLIDEYPYLLSARFRMGNSLDVVIADAVFLDFFGERSPMQANINVGEENLSEFESWLADYTTGTNPDLDYISRERLKAEFDGLSTAYLALGGSLSFVLALIGILNFVNATAASVIARRREFAMLQSVGMTGRQLRRTLFFEGCCHTALSTLFTLTAGAGIGLMITQVIAGQVWFFRENFSPLPSILCLPPLLAVCAAAPIICNAKMNRDSVIERLRAE
jgi:putative ABC transport system permease protein